MGVRRRLENHATASNQNPDAAAERDGVSRLNNCALPIHRANPLATEPHSDPSPPAAPSSGSGRQRSAPEPSHILPRLNTRVPLFELVLLLVAGALGWITFRAHTALNEISGRPPPPPKFQQAEEIRTTESVENREPAKPQDLQEILNLSILLDLKNRYADLADNIEPGLADMREALQGFVRTKDRSEVKRFRDRSLSVEQWLAKQEQNVDVRKLQTLRDWLLTLPATNAPIASANLAEMLGQFRRTYSNFVAAAPLVEGQRLTPDMVQAKLVRLSQPEAELLSLTRHARSQTEAVAAFIKERQTPAAPAPQQPAVPRTTTVIRPIGDGGASFIAEYTELQGTVRDWFQPLLYLLIGVLIVQCIVAIVAAYNRVVVLPLRQRLIEDNTAVEHQRKLTHFARLATSLAHEIRNPLTAISVRLFTLQKNLKPGSSEHSDASLIRNEIDRLEQIVKNFLKLARPSEPKVAAIPTEPVLREVAALLGPQLQKRGVELKLGEFSIGSFLGDPLQIKQVLINLIQNAAESIDGRGAVTLRSRETAGAGGARAVVIEVEDTGSGISPDVEERLFDPFFSTKDSGTGLGLAIAAKIIEQHKGSLDFETRPGDGTVFRLTLPASSQ